MSTPITPTPPVAVSPPAPTRPPTVDHKAVAELAQTQANAAQLKVAELEKQITEQAVEALANVKTAQAKAAELEAKLAELKSRPTTTAEHVHHNIADDKTIQDLREKVAVLEKNQKALETTKLASTELLEAKATATEMPICDCRVHLDKLHDLPKVGVTPAEVVLLVSQFHKQKGDMPIHDMQWHKVTTPKLDDKKKIVRNGEDNTAIMEVVEVKTVKREAHQEIGRLKSRYGAKKVELIFPGANPNLPQSFKSALQMGLSVVVPGESLSKEQGGDKLGAIVINA